MAWAYNSPMDGGGPQNLDLFWRKNKVPLKNRQNINLNHIQHKDPLTPPLPSITLSILHFAAHTCIVFCILYIQNLDGHIQLYI